MAKYLVIFKKLYWKEPFSEKDPRFDLTLGLSYYKKSVTSYAF